MFFLDRFFKKYRNINFHENPSSGSRVATSGRTDGPTDRYHEAKGRFSKKKQLLKRASKTQNSLIYSYKI